MNYLSVSFIVFFVVFLILYYSITPQKRYMIIFLGSYIFYGYARPAFLLVLGSVTLVSYIGGLAIQKYKTRVNLVIFLSLNFILLFAVKYANFLKYSITRGVSYLGYTSISIPIWDISLPIGLSFIVFQSSTYLLDIYRNNIVAEKNLIRFGAFVAFFPTVLCGPIQKSRKLIPQITNPHSFSFDQAQKGTILIVWGVFEKTMIANKLCDINTAVLDNYVARSSAEILIAVIAFSIYIYADFSSYSDMARGISKILGIDVGKNFNNPYLAISISEFWNRWHVSLNEWLRENVYIPLGGNRKGNIRTYLNVLIIFIISGLWHGAYWHFVVWGLINGILAVIGQIMRPIKKRVYAFLSINDGVESLVLIRRVIVFYLVSLTWVFFTKGVADSVEICRRILTFDFLSLFDPSLLELGGTVTRTLVMLFLVMVFGKIQYYRQDENHIFKLYSMQPFIFQCSLMAAIICICVFGAFLTGASVNTQFMYFQF